MPSGKAGLTTRIRTHITPIKPPYHQRAHIGVRGRDRFRDHVDQAKGVAAEHDMPIPGKREHRVGVAADEIEEGAGGHRADQTAGDQAIVSDLGVDQKDTAEQAGECRWSHRCSLP